MYIAIVLTALIAGAAGQCFDTFPEKCEIWAAADFCHNPFYASIQYQCQKTCGRCGSPVCGANSVHAIGPCFSGGCGGNTMMPGYDCNSRENLCCPTVKFDDPHFQQGPSVGGMCPVGYTVVFGLGPTVDPKETGICVSLNSQN